MHEPDLIELQFCFQGREKMEFEPAAEKQKECGLLHCVL